MVSSSTLKLSSDTICTMASSSSHASEEVATPDPATNLWQVLASQPTCYSPPQGHGLRQIASSSTAMPESIFVPSRQSTPVSGFSSEAAPQTVASSCSLDLAASSQEIQDRWLAKFLAGRLHPELVDPEALPTIERLLLGWHSAICAAESCNQLNSWDGIRARAGDGIHYWIYSRSLNACWRLCHLKQKRGKYVVPPKIRLECAWGRCSRRLCTCLPDPWQPLPAIEPSIAPHCNNPLTIETSATGPGLGHVPPRGLEGEAYWRNLLRGTHAFSLQGSPPVSLYAQSEHNATAARFRIENTGWRRWHMAHEDIMQKDREYNKRCKENGDAPKEQYRSTPAPSAAETPQCWSTSAPSAAETPRTGNQYFAMHGDHALPVLPLLGSAPPSQMVLLPIPIHLVDQVRCYTEQLLQNEAAHDRATLLPSCTDYDSADGSL